MTVKGVLLRFCVIYVGLLLAAGTLMNYFSIKAEFGVGIGILAWSVTWVCYAFGEKNGRYFTRREKIAVIIGCIFIDILVQIVPTLAKMSQLRSGPVNLPVVFLIGLAILADSLIILWRVNSARKWLLRKGIIKTGDTKAAASEQARLRIYPVLAYVKILASIIFVSLIGLCLFLILKPVYNAIRQNKGAPANVQEAFLPPVRPKTEAHGLLKIENQPVMQTAAQTQMPKIKGVPISNRGALAHVREAYWPPMVLKTQAYGPLKTENRSVMQAAARAQMPKIEGVPIKIGDTLDDVQKAYSTTLEPVAHVYTPVETEYQLPLKNKGVLVVFDKPGRVVTIRLEAPFGGNIGGVKIGDSKIQAEQLLGAPARIKYPPFVAMEAYDYFFNGINTTRILFNPRGEVAAIILFK